MYSYSHSRSRYYHRCTYVVSIKGEKRWGHAKFDRKSEALALCKKLVKAGIEYKFTKQ